MSVLLSCLCLVDWPLSFAFDWDCREVLQILSPVKLNWIVFCDINLSLATAAATGARWTKANTWNIRIRGAFLLRPISPKWWMAFRSAQCKFIFFSVDCVTVHHGSAKKKKKKGFQVASHKFPMLLHQGCSESKECLSCSTRHSFLQLLSTCCFHFRCLFKVNQAKRSDVFRYLFYKTELMLFQVVCTF